MQRAGSIVLLLALSACASVGGMKEEPLTEGKVQSYEADFESVVDAARESMVSAKLKIEEAYQPKDRVWVLVGKKGTSAWSWGELVRVVVDDQDQSDDVVVVRVITKRKGALNVTAKGDYSENIFSGIRLSLATDAKDASGSSKEQSGGPIPRMVP